MTVTTSAGKSTDKKTDQFTYVAQANPPSPPSASTPAAPDGGTVVTITGTNLIAATAVSFGAGTATIYTVNSPTQIDLGHLAGARRRAPLTSP